VGWMCSIATDAMSSVLQVLAIRSVSLTAFFEALGLSLFSPQVHQHVRGCVLVTIPPLHGPMTGQSLFGERVRQLAGTHEQRNSLAPVFIFTRRVHRVDFTSAAGWETSTRSIVARHSSAGAPSHRGRVSDVLASSLPAFLSKAEVSRCEQSSCASLAARSAFVFPIFNRPKLTDRSPTPCFSIGGRDSSRLVCLFPNGPPCSLIRFDNPLARSRTRQS